MLSLRPTASILFLFATVLLITLLVACGGASTDSPSPTPAPIPTPTPASTALPSPTPPPLPSPPPEPTPTPIFDRAMQLPHDEGVHASPLEWWYFNGHVATEGGRVFSYHFVTFQSVLEGGFTPRLAQLSWADHDMDLHLIAEQPDLPILETTSGEFDLSIAGWRMSGDSKTYHLSFQIGDYSVELEADSRKPAVLHHDTGLVDLGIAGKTYYYSRTDLETSGTVSVSGISHPVTGFPGSTTSGVTSPPRRSAGTGSASTLTTAPTSWSHWSGSRRSESTSPPMAPTSRRTPPRYICRPATSPLNPPGPGPAPDTQGVYPMGWNLLVNSLDMGLVLTPVIEEAEFAISTFIPVIYWEGAVAVSGSKGGIDVSGRGFVEMVGYVPSAPIAPPTPPAQP